MKHIPIIHSLRGVAALAVCLHHFVSTTIGLFDKPVQEAFHYGMYGVQMFFVISGVVIPLSMINANYSIKNFFVFMKKRIIRIEPAYLVSIGLALVYVFLRQIVPGTAPIDLTPSLSNIILHIGYLIPFFKNHTWLNPVYWTLAIEFQYYLLLSLFIPLFLSKKRIIKLSTIVLFCIIGFALPHSKFIFSWLPCFMFGISFVLYKNLKLNKMEYFITLIMSSITLYLYQGAFDVAVAFFTLFLINFFPNLKSNFTNFFGDISYSLYLIHSLIGAAFINFMTHRVESLAERILVVLVGLIITILASYLMYRLVEKPTHEYAKKIKLNESKRDYKLVKV